MKEDVDISVCASKNGINYFVSRSWRGASNVLRKSAEGIWLGLS